MIEEGAVTMENTEDEQSLRVYCAEDNPLNIKPVLEVFFAVMGFESIKVCRMVNHQWAEIGLSTIRRKGVLRPRNCQSFFYFLNDSSMLETFRGFEVDLRFLEYNDDDQNSSNSSSSRNFWTVYSNTVDLAPKRLHCHIPLTGIFPSDRDDGMQISYNTLEKLVWFLNHSHLVLETLRLFIKNVESVNVHMNDDAKKPRIPDELKILTYPELTTFEVPDEIHSEEFESLCLSVVRRTPKLLRLALKSSSQKFWKEVSGANVRWDKLESLSLPNFTLHVLDSLSCHTFSNLKILRIQFLPEISIQLLMKVASTLENLEFFTPTESVLSPITFPRMPNLRVLGCGNSQSSFPSITNDKLPNLQELRVSYWDWVFTFEDVEVYYYWQTDNPHTSVEILDINFPSLRTITGNYRLMENLEDFFERIVVKFPNFHTLKVRGFSNYRRMSVISFDISAHCCGIKSEKLRNFHIMDYRNVVQLPFIGRGVFPHLACKNIEIWDLNPEMWSKTIKRNEWDRMYREFMQRVDMTFSDYLTLVIKPDSYEKLHTLKLLWIPGLSVVELIAKFPALKHLEVVGNKCILVNLQELKTLRPALYFYAHKCYCPLENKETTQNQ